MTRSLGNLPPQPDNDTIHLPALIADNFGVSPSIIRMQIATGTVTIDGVESQEKFDFKRSEIEGKVVTVKGTQRSFQLRVPTLDD